VAILPDGIQDAAAEQQAITLGEQPGRILPHRRIRPASDDLPIPDNGPKMIPTMKSKAGALYDGPPRSVSIIVPTYNHERLLAEALRSIDRALAYARDNRTFPISLAAETIVVDDASTDGTSDMIARNFPGVRYLRNEVNRGQGHSRNRGAKASTGEILFFLDADDAFFVDHILIGATALFHNPVCAYCRTSVATDAPVLPHWQQVIDDTMVQNLCIYRLAHELTGGFIEDLLVNRFTVEDAFYSRLIAEMFVGARVSHKTIHYTRRPGNLFDRQLPKFQRDPADAPPNPPELEAALPDMERLFAAHREAAHLRMKGQAFRLRGSMTPGSKETIDLTADLRPLFAAAGDP
jgi:glycosyltransferase involved in cell wall biosynthesis